MKSNQLISAVLKLAEQCEQRKTCKGCPLAASGGGCLLRKMSLPDVAKKFSKRGILWVRCTRVEAVHLKEILKQHQRRENDQYSLRLYYYDRETRNVHKAPDLLLSSEAVREAISMFAEENVKVQLENGDMVDLGLFYR